MPVAEYELTNLAINGGVDNGDQQIAIRPYDEVTSLNVNQLLNHVAAHGPATMHVVFEQSGSNGVRIRVKEGFVGYFQDRVEHDIDGDGENIQDRSYIVKVSFDEDATVERTYQEITQNGAFQIWRNQDYREQLGVDNPAHRRLFLVLQYSWEEGMLGSATGEGGGVNRHARLWLLNRGPQELFELLPSQYEKTIYLGEILGLDDALDHNDTTIDASQLKFRPLDFQTLDVFENLRMANNNMRVSFNPTGDYLYIGHGKVYLGSSLIEIPEGLAWRVRGVVPRGVSSTDSETKTPILVSSVEFNSSGEPVDEEGNLFEPGSDPEDIKGQYDVLVMNKKGEIGWIVRPMTHADDDAWSKPKTHAYEKGYAQQSLPQTPGITQEDSDRFIDNPISKISPELNDTYLILLVLRRLYYEEGGNLHLHNRMWNIDSKPPFSTRNRDWLIYEHNPLFPFLSIPDATQTMNISDLLTVPIQKD